MITEATPITTLILQTKIQKKHTLHPSILGVVTGRHLLPLESSVESFYLTVASWVVDRSPPPQILHRSDTVISLSDITTSGGLYREKYSLCTIVPPLSCC